MNRAGRHTMRYLSCKIASPTVATCRPAASIAARHACRSDFPVIKATASAANTLSPAPQTSRTSVGVAGRCHAVPVRSAQTIPQRPRVTTTLQRPLTADSNQVTTEIVTGGRSVGNDLFPEILLQQCPLFALDFDRIDWRGAAGTGPQGGPSPLLTYCGGEIIATKSAHRLPMTGAEYSRVATSRA